MALLDLIQNVCDDLGLNSPDVVIANNDLQVTQLLQIANRECTDLASRYRWQELIREGSFTTVAITSQGKMKAIASDVRYIINDTIWNRTQRRPVLGPINSRDWQLQQSSPVSGPFDQYRIRGNELLFDPIPEAGQSCYFEYMSKNWCESVSGSRQAKFTNDADITLLDQSLVELGVIWRWNKRKGFDYAQDFDTYEIRVTDAMARNATKPVLDMAGGIGNFQPGIFVPQSGYGQ